MRFSALLRVRHHRRTSVRAPRMRPRLIGVTLAAVVVAAFGAFAFTLPFIRSLSPACTLRRTVRCGAWPCAIILAAASSIFGGVLFVDAGFGDVQFLEGGTVGEVARFGERWPDCAGLDARNAVRLLLMYHSVDVSFLARACLRSSSSSPARR